MLSFRLGLAAALVLHLASAQQPAAAPQPEAATGTVSGTVLAEDSQRPVRFAQVFLQSVGAADVTTPPAQRQGYFGQGRSSAQTRTEVDGTFEAGGIAPGDYYVMASAAGYIAQRSLLQEALAGGADAAALLASIPVVHVVADSNSSANVTLRRGATLTGRATWEDGSPASGLSLEVLSSTADTSLPPLLRGLEVPQGSRSTQTDDRGAFRFSGLPTGEYVVRAVIIPAQQSGGAAGRGGGRYFSPIILYSNGVFRRGEAKAYAIRAGDERDDVRMTIDLRSLRNVSGYLSSANSGQKVASGRVVAQDGSDRQLSVTGMITPDGRFDLKYVPPGNYTLTVYGASSEARSADTRGRDRASSTTATTYQDRSQALQVGDAEVTGVNITLTPTAHP